MEEYGDGWLKTEIEDFKSHIIDYLKNRLAYFKLSAIEYIAKVAPAIVFISIMALILLVFWIFANVTIAIAIGNASGNLMMGFLIVSVFNLLITAFVVVMRKKLIFKPVSNWMVKTLVKNLEPDEDE